jgi:hypothetical protein
MDSKRLLPLSGVVFVALILLSIIGISGGTPSSGASADEVASFYDENMVRQAIGTFVLAAAVPFLVFFGVALTRTRSHGDESVWRQVTLAGTILAGGAILATAFVHFALVDGGDQKISPTALQALNSLDGNTWMAFNPAFGVMMLGAAGILLSAGVMRWLGWSAVVLGVAAFIPFADFFALVMSLLWIVVTSFVLARAKSEPAYAAAPGAA